ncbi:MAG: DUF1801 domain-containing protein [Gemmataceae bacterium]
MDADISEFIAGLPPDMRRLVSALRKLVRRTAPEAEESMVWGSLSYHRPNVGGRVKGSLCLIVAKKGEVRLDFIHGVRLADPASLLRGRQTSKRYVLIENRAMIDLPEVADLIRQAAEFDPAAPSGNPV